MNRTSKQNEVRRKASTSSTRSAGNRKRNSGSANKNFSINKLLFVIFIICLVIFCIFKIALKNDGKTNKYIYINNERVSLKKPYKIKMAKNQKAKVLLLSLDDVVDKYDKDLKYDSDSGEIVTVGFNQVAKMKVGDFAINVNGTRIEINHPVVKEDSTIYLPFNDLLAIYNFELDITEDDKVFLDNLFKEKRVIQVQDKTKLKKGKGLFSKNIEVLKSNEDYFLISETRNQYMIRTKKGNIGYINKDRAKNILDIRAEYKKGEKINYGYIENYSSPKDNSDNLKNVNTSEKNIVLIDLMYLGGNNKVVSKYEHDSKAYKIYREKIGEINGIPVAQFKLKKKELSQIINTFDNRQSNISEIIRNGITHKVKGINLVVDDLDFSKENYDKEFVEQYDQYMRELKARLSGRGFFLVLNKENITKKTKDIIEYIK